MARVNLNAVLRTLEQLPKYDSVSQGIIDGVHEIIQLISPAATVRLAINDGEITHHLGAGRNTINLGFPSAKAVNKMFAGTGNPIPLKGLRKIDFLKGPFTQLTDQLTKYLAPSAEDLKNQDFSRANAVMTLYVAVFALAEIANSDPLGVQIAARMPDGDLQVAVRDGSGLIARVRGHKVKIVEGLNPAARAKMIFSNIDVAGQVLRGEIGSYEAIGHHDIELGGFVPLLDEFNKLLSLVPRYLQA